MFEDVNASVLMKMDKDLAIAIVEAHALDNAILGLVGLAFIGGLAFFLIKINS